MIKLHPNWPPSVRLMRRMVVVGLALSVMSLFVTLGVVSGFAGTFQEKILAFQPHITVTPLGVASFGAKDLKKFWEEAGLPPEQLKKLEPVLYREALLVNQGTIRGALLKGVESEKNLRLGVALATKMNLSADQKQLRILIPQRGEGGSKLVSLPLGETFETGMYELDEQFVEMNLGQLQKMFGVPASQTSLEIQLEDPFLAEQFAALLENHLPPTFEVQNWMELYRPLLSAFQLEHWFFRIVIGFMTLVAGLNLVGAILISIFHRKREITILKVLGLLPRRIIGIFTLEGLRLGGIGLGVGMLLGVALLAMLKHFARIAIDPEIYFLDHLPVAFPWPEFGWLSVGVLLLVALVARVTAGQALRIPIREGLHGPG